MIKFKQFLCDRDFKEALHIDCSNPASNKCISDFKDTFNEAFRLFKIRFNMKYTKYEILSASQK